MGDFALTWSYGEADLSVTDDDLTTEEGLRTACLLSMFLDRRAESDDPLPAEDGDRRGWWADEFLEAENDKVGSRLWLLDRAKRTPDIVPRAEEYVRECLAWMVADKVLERFDVQVETDEELLGILVTLYRPDGTSAEFRFSHAWEGEEAAAAGPAPDAETPAITVFSGGLVTVDGAGTVEVAAPANMPVNDFLAEVTVVWDGLTVESGHLGIWEFFGGNMSFFLSTDSLGRPALRYSFDGTTPQGPISAPTGNLVAGVPTRLAFSIGNGSVQFYEEGKKLGGRVNLSASTDLNGSSSAALLWGRDTENSVTNTGDVGFTRFWNRELQPEEYLENYHLATVDLPPSLQSAVIDEWNMQSDLSSYSGNNDAALVGSATQTDDAYTYPSAYEFEWSTSAADWESLLGLAIEHGWIMDTALPIADMQSLAPINVDGSLDTELEWTGRKGGKAVGADVTTGAFLATTATGVLSPGTSEFSLFMSINNGTADAANSNRSMLTTNGTGSGLRLIIRNNTTTEYLNPTAENSGGTPRSPQINAVIGSGQNVDILLSRTSPTTIECWAAIDGDPTVYHDSVTIGAAENFDEGASAFRIGGAAPGNLLAGGRFKAAIFALEGGSADIFDLYRNQVRSGVLAA